MKIGPHYLHVPLRICDEYTLSIEAVQVGGEPMRFIHCEVRRWSARVAVKLRHDVITLAGAIGAPLYAYKLEPDDKWRSFVALFGFVEHGTWRVAGAPVECWRLV